MNLEEDHIVLAAEYVLGTLDAWAAQRIEAVGFSRAEAMLPVDARSFDGYRLLHEYFAFPARFMSCCSPSARAASTPPPAGNGRIW